MQRARLAMFKMPWLAEHRSQKLFWFLIINLKVKDFQLSDPKFGFSYWVCSQGYTIFLLNATAEVSSKELKLFTIQQLFLCALGTVHIRHCVRDDTVRKTGINMSLTMSAIRPLRNDSG